jgi:hypothetical protein
MLRGVLPPFKRVQPSFVASLVSSIRPERAAGSPTLTFTRATTAYVSDFEGRLFQALSGEVRFQGARRVRNLVTTPDLSNAAWAKEQGGTGSAPTLTYGQTDPNGGATATRAQLNRGAGNTASDYSGVYFRAIAAGATGRIAIKSNTGSSQTLTLKLDNTSQVQLTATTAWQTFSVSRTQTGNQDFEVISWGQNPSSTNSLDLLIAFPQVENVTGQSNQNPSEYVSVGVLSAPFHGAGVDGVKYFTYENGNTVTNNVVTEAQGAAISSSTLLGYLPEGARTDSALYNRDLTQTDWAKTDCTALKNAVGKDGAANACSTLTATGANATCLQTVTATSAAKVFQPSVKRKTGTGTVEITVNGGANWQDITSALSAGAFYAAAETRTVTNPVFGFRLATSGDEIIVDFAGCQNGTFRSTDIGPTTTVAVTRNIDVNQGVSAGNLNSAAMTIVLSWTPSAAGMGTAFLFGTYVDADNYTAILHDGTNVTARKRIAGVNSDATRALTYAAGTTYRIAARFDGNGVDVWVAGTKGTGSATGTASQIGTNFQIGADGNGANSAFGGIKNFAVYGQGLSDSQVAAL